MEKSFAKRVMLRLIVGALVLSLVLTLGVWPALAKAGTFTDSYEEPVDLVVFVACAANGAGEWVELTGTLHFLFHTTIDNQGGFHSKFHFQSRGITGLGLTTGDKYQGINVLQGTTNGNVGFTQTLENNFRIVGQGPGNNFWLHQTIHVTFNANGEVTASVENVRSGCDTVSYP